MPTNKPRINLTVSQNLNETLSRLAELQGRSRGAVVVDLLEAIHPPLMRTVSALEAAQSAPEELRENLRKTVEEMEQQINASLGGGIEQMDMLLQQLQSSATRGQPPHSNTGVRSTTRTQNQQDTDT
ncbi:MAG: ELKS/Rab6-interacting/CAST family protein [Thioalkalivibrio sp.]|nr:ELKS/Rab6-interacting/CAST family protein [Thioalkalivibrio sp.]